MKVFVLIKKNYSFIFFIKISIINIFVIEFISLERKPLMSSERLMKSNKNRLKVNNQVIKSFRQGGHCMLFNLFDV